MIALIATAEPTQWALVFVGLPFGGAMIWIGWRTWQGRHPGHFGPRPPYQSYFGAAHAVAPGGVGLATLALGELVRGTLGLDRQGGFYLAAAMVAFGLIVVSVIYNLCYFWFGVPPRLRPPYQRDQLKPDHGRPTVRDRLRTLRR